MVEILGRRKIESKEDGGRVAVMRVGMDQAPVEQRVEVEVLLLKEEQETFVEHQFKLYLSKKEEILLLLLQDDRLRRINFEG